MSARLARPLDGVLTALLGETVSSVKVSRSQFSTSFPIDNVSVTFATGQTLALVRKDLDWSALGPEARIAKPPFLHDPGREIGVYKELLAVAPAGTARCFGIVDEPKLGRRWLFLERLGGVELFQVGDADRWAECARWAARLHRAFAGSVEELRVSGVPLLVHDRQWLGQWADRALGQSSRSSVSALKFLHDRTDALADRLLSLEPTLAHGEFYASNVIVSRPSAAATRVSPIDWEMAAIAPGLIDLAALTAGRMDPVMRVDIENAYCEAAGRCVDGAFLDELDACRLAMCLQWLGWMPRWRPPADHAQDWLAEALALADRLGL